MQRDADRLLDVILGYMGTQVLLAMARLGVPDLLGDGSRSPGDLAEATGADPDAMRRLLRAGTAVGVLRADGPDRYALTGPGALLQSTAGSLRDLVLMLRDPGLGGLTDELAEAVRAGAAVDDKVLGRDFWTYLRENPDEAMRFAGGLTGLSVATVPSLLEEFDPSPYELIVDVGGGQGMLLSGVLDRAPGARGVLLDTPETIEMAVKDDRIEARAGDFFDEVPAGGDLYLIKNVLHDWEKEDAGRILANIRRAGRPGHRLVVCEWLIPGNGEAPIAPYLIDLILLSSVGGRSRTADEFRELLTANGYAVDQVTPLSGGQHLVVAHAP